MSVVKGSYYGRVRRLAFSLWSGPKYIEKQDEDNPFGGGCILRLAVRKEASVKVSSRLQIEARSVYALLHDDTQDNAVLRAVYWDSQTVVRPSPPETTPIKIPAKFVSIPVSLLRQWIGLFGNLQTSIQPASDHEYDGTPICTLRVEASYVSSVFEKVWPVVESEDRELNQVWQDVWQQMGEALQTYPIITGIEESFRYTLPEPDSYDFPAYQPSLTLP